MSSDSPSTDATEGSSNAGEREAASNSSLRGCREDLNKSKIEDTEETGEDLDQGKDSPVLSEDSSKGGREEPNPNDSVEGSKNNLEEAEEKAPEKEELNQEADEKQLMFSAPDMVWGKVICHPWWPGQIVHPSFASEKALKRRKKGHFLVAYFGDKTFSWNYESQLQTFESSFSHMMIQCSTSTYLSAVCEALGEVARRTEIGMACGCTIGMLNADLMHQKFENSGVREGTVCPIVDRCRILNSFEPRKLLDFVQELALFSSEDCNKLELVKATAQVKVFSTLNFQDHPDFHIGEIISTPGQEESEKKSRDRPSRRNKSLPDLVEDEVVSSKSSGKKRRTTDSDSAKLKKKRSESPGDPRSVSAAALARAVKFGQSMRRVASEIKRSSPGFEASQKGTINEIGLLLSQLRSAAKNPAKNDSSKSVVVSFFTRWRERCSSDSALNNQQIRRAERRIKEGFDESDLVSVEVKTAYSPESTNSKGSSRGRKRKAESETPKQSKKSENAVETPNFCSSCSAGEKSDEHNSAAVILSFTDPDSIPTESELIGFFSQFGPLKEAETKISRNRRTATVIFKVGGDAAAAYSSENKFSAFGPGLRCYRIKYLASSPLKDDNAD